MAPFPEHPLSRARTSRQFVLFGSPEPPSPPPDRPWRSGDRRVERGLTHLGARLDGRGVLRHGAGSLQELHGAVPMIRPRTTP